MVNHNLPAPREKIRIWDVLLLIGLALSPMTGLRIWKIGPAELLVFIWGFRYALRRTIKMEILARFFIGFLGAMAFGTLCGLIAAPEEVNLEGWPTWIYLMFVSLAMYQGLESNDLQYNERLLSGFATLAVLWQIILFALAKTGVQFVFGAPLWFSNRYSGGGTNPHQVAVMLCGLIFVFLREVLKRRRVLWNLLLAAASINILLATKSSTGVLAVVFGAIFEAMVFINRGTKNEHRRIILILLELLVGAVLLLLTYRIIYRLAYEWIASDSNGLGRLEIFSGIGQTFRTSPLFGLGPGIHAKTAAGGLVEYHNTYLEVLAASGIVGMGVLVLFTIRLFARLTGDITLIPIVVAMYAYGLSGFSMRRLVYWGLIILVLVLGEQIKNWDYNTAETE